MSAGCSWRTISAASPGALPLSQLGLRGKAVTPHPAIVVNFRSWSSGCDEPTNCSVEVADTVLRQGQGMQRQLQPRRHHEFHGGDRARLQGRPISMRFRSATPMSARRPHGF